MLFGAMNNPTKPLSGEIARISEAGFDYVDYTYEPPVARFNDPGFLRDLFKRYNLGVVGHTAYYLQIAQPFEIAFSGAKMEFISSIRKLQDIGAKKFTLHYDSGYSLQTPEERIQLHYKMLTEILAEVTLPKGGKLMLENSPKGKGQFEMFTALMETVPKLHMHLDVAHAWVMGGMREIERFLSLGRLTHLHFSDNDGSSDQHLPLGAPAKNGIPWPDVVKAIKEIGYDDTITLEVFAPRKELLADSLKYVQDLWANA